ncbi:MAG: FAD-dependent monooxygenase [Bacteroides sp.]|jgi:uncharacterized FAD-dependent dehydrogenase|nr:FAD-dependent monooxygenase [Bacteroides sp.]
MGFQILEIKLPTGYHQPELRALIARQLGIQNFSFQIESQSLDARNKSRIHWLVRVGVTSDELKSGEPLPQPCLEIPYRKRDQKVFILGSGPAGFFSALVLQMAGFETLLVERGAEVDTRAGKLHQFEKTGDFSPMANYSFGEGGAGTFSDGKLTSRSKHISCERAFFTQQYIQAGAPPEIAYLAHPHVGSDKLRVVIKNLREQYQSLGGKILFETLLSDLVIQQGRVEEAVTSSGTFSADHFVLAPGHSAYETYRMLISRGVPFRIKNFALGSRAEHPQALINRAQWGTEKLEGVKAAEYRLTSPGDGKHPVYSFCMCPGGMVVPAATYAHVNTVNGMSYYKRAGQFANAACVAGVHPTQLSAKIQSPLDAMAWLEDLEHSFYKFSKGYGAPACTIADFLKGKMGSPLPKSSYPLGLLPAPLWEMLPPIIVSAMREGLKDFSRKLRGYDQGILLGLESKTSSPIQVIRNPQGLVEGFENLYLAGEASGFAGGIVSSAADGIKIAMKISGE